LHRVLFGKFNTADGSPGAKEKPSLPAPIAKISIPGVQQPDLSVKTGMGERKFKMGVGGRPGILLWTFLSRCDKRKGEECGLARLLPKGS